MPYVHRIIFAACLLLATLSAVAVAAPESAPAIRVDVNKKSVLIGDRVRYTIRVKAKAGTQVLFPKFAENRIGDFEIKDSGRASKKSVFGALVQSRWYDIAAYATGAHLIPPQEIKYKDRGAKDWSVAKTEQAVVAVGSVLPANTKLTDIRDIKGPLHFYEFPWILLITSLAAIGASIFAVKTYLRLKARLAILPPDALALGELEAARTLFAKTGDVKEYYAGISGSVRRYIEMIFHMKAPEMTTEEFLLSLKDSAALTEEQKRLLKDFMQACDLVKFAKYAATKSEAEAVFVTAKTFVEETRRKNARL
ncbi:MAG: hypothetical protein JW919_01440 [Candidatus Omnitrophica bacterium]|nr:hypothetical protein [Candidatus Omnitrophota bacterium]